MRFRDGHFCEPGLNQDLNIQYYDVWPFGQTPRLVTDDHVRQKNRFSVGVFKLAVLSNLAIIKNKMVTIDVDFLWLGPLCQNATKVPNIKNPRFKS